MMMVVVVLRGGVVVMMVVVVIVDVPVGKKERGRGGRRLLGGRYACRQGTVALDGAVPARRTQLGGWGEEAQEAREKMHGGG